MIYGYVNMFSCLDANAFVFSIEKVSACRDAIRAAYEAVGGPDVALSTT